MENAKADKPFTFNAHVRNYWKCGKSDEVYEN
jgi:hypothetical protein